MKEVRFEKNKLIVEGKVIKEFDLSIRGIECYDRIIVVLLAQSIKAPCNVYGVDYDGKIIWQICEYKSIRGVDDKVPPFNGLRKNDDKTVWVTDYYTVEWSYRKTALLLDIYTGKVIKVVKVKDNELIVEDRVIKTFDYRIREIECYDRVIVVLLDDYIVPFNENVFGVDYEGKILWQIPKDAFIQEEGTRIPYNNLGRNDDKTIWVENLNVGRKGKEIYDATALLVEAYTGKVIKTVRFKNNQLMVDNRVIKTFDYPIEEIKCYNYGRKIVVLLAWSKVPFSENVYGVDYEGITIWQIPKYKSIHSGRSPFVGLGRNDDKTVWAMNIDGGNLLLDIYTGKELDRELVRF